MKTIKVKIDIAINFFNDSICSSIRDIQFIATKRIISNVTHCALEKTKEVLSEKNKTKQNKKSWCNLFLF